MDAIRRLRPALFGTVGLMFLANTAAAQLPCADEACVVPGACAPTFDECAVGGCDNDACGSGGCGCLSGQPCSCGAGCSCSSGVFGNGRWGWFGGDDDDRPDNGLIGTTQKCRHGKLWPPYPRPQENGKYWTQFHAAHYWPHPYNCWDRSWTKHILAVQNANGWTQATTMCAYHFDADTHCLNDSGRLHLQWILMHVPAQFRTVYVAAGDNGYVSSTRQSSVESEAVAIGAGSAPIVVRPVLTAGRPANEVDAIRRSELETQPAPRIRITDLGTGAGDDNASEAEDGGTQ